MSWSVPRTWTAGELVGETIMNTHIRDNLNYLFAPAFQQIVTGSGVSLSASASTAVPVHANLVITATTKGGNVEVYFEGRFSGAGVQLNLDYNGTAWVATASGIIRQSVDRGQMHYHVWVTGLASGQQVFRPTWLQIAGTFVNLEFDINPAIFWVRGH